MPSFNDCIDIAQASGKITKEVADEIKAADDQLLATNRFAENLTRIKRETAIQAARKAEAWKNIQSYPKDKNHTQYDGLNALLTKDPKGKAPYMNVEYQQSVWTNKYLSMFGDALSKFRTRRLGFSQDKAGLDKLIKAIYGETVDDAEIMAFSKTWHEMVEKVRQDFNSMGGSISKNNRWLLPQNHDIRSIEKLGLNGWKSLLEGKLDRSRMTNDFGKKLSDKEMDEALDFLYEEIVSGGLNKAADFTVPRLGTKLSRKGAEKRFLYFKDADGWMEYQKIAGRGDIFTTLTDWVEMKASDIALMQVLGTNPTNTMEALTAQVMKSQKLSGREKLQSKALFNVVSGKINGGEMTSLADFGTATRSVLVAGLLGNAMISALTDIGFAAITSRFNGLPAMKALGRQLALMKPGAEDTRIFAIKMGLGADAMLGRAHGANRYADIFGTGATAKLSEGVMRASLLAPWTAAGQKGFGMEFSSMLADNFGKTIDELDAAVQQAFKTYGIDGDDWNKFRKTKTLDHKSAKYADLTKSDKFNRMVLSETDFAIPMPDARVRAITTGGLEKGTIEGQAWRSFMMLKSFPLGVIFTHFYRGAYQATTGQKLEYLGALLATTTTLGAIVIQAKDMQKGREPRPMDTKEFFMAALAQGGGLGILGDFLFSDVNRFGGGLSKTLAGPVVGLADDVAKFTLGNVQEAFKREETNVLGEGIGLLKRYAPDVWQTQLLSNALFDQMSLMADPDAQKRFRRIVKKRQADYDQGYWFKPGQPVPEILK